MFFSRGARFAQSSFRSFQYMKPAAQARYYATHVKYTHLANQEAILTTTSTTGVQQWNGISSESIIPGIVELTVSEDDDDILVSQNDVYMTGCHMIHRN